MFRILAKLIHTVSGHTDDPEKNLTDKLL